MNANGFCGVEKEYIRKHHIHEPKENQCSSFLVKHIRAPVHLVRSPLSLSLNAFTAFFFSVDRLIYFQLCCD